MPPLDNAPDALRYCGAVGGDLNERAKGTLSTLAEFVGLIHPVRAFVSVTNDACAGGFPIVLERFFSDPDFDYDQPFVVDGLEMTSTSPCACVGRISFESKPDTARRLVCHEDFIPWRSNLWVGGWLMGPDACLEALRADPFRSDPPWPDKCVARFGTDWDLTELRLQIKTDDEALRDSILSAWSRATTA